MNGTDDHRDSGLGCALCYHSRGQEMTMIEDYDFLCTNSCHDSPPNDQPGWKLVGFNLFYRNDGIQSSYIWARNRKLREDKIKPEIRAGAPQEIWANYFELRETEYDGLTEHDNDPDRPWMIVFTDTVTYPMDMGANRNEAVLKKETHIVWARERLLAIS